jgi:hypothetical protein
MFKRFAGQAPAGPGTRLDRRQVREIWRTPTGANRDRLTGRAPANRRGSKLQIPTTSYPRESKPGERSERRPKSRADPECCHDETAWKCRAKPAPARPERSYHARLLPAHFARLRLSRGACSKPRGCSAPSSAQCSPGESADRRRAWHGKPRETSLAGTNDVESRVGA